MPIFYGGKLPLLADCKQIKQQKLTLKKTLLDESYHGTRKEKGTKR
jgi:hypothetical protein